MQLYKCWKKLKLCNNLIKREKRINATSILTKIEQEAKRISIACLRLETRWHVARAVRWVQLVGDTHYLEVATCVLQAMVWIWSFSQQDIATCYLHLCKPLKFRSFMLFFSCWLVLTSLCVRKYHLNSLGHSFEVTRSKYFLMRLCLTKASYSRSHASLLRLSKERFWQV